MAINYLMTALSLYKLQYDKYIKIAFGIIYGSFVVYNLWWLSEALILLKMKNCPSDIATIETANPYSYDGEIRNLTLYDETYLNQTLSDYNKTYIAPKFRVLSNTSYYVVFSQAFIIFFVILVALFLIRRVILKK